MSPLGARVGRIFAYNQPVDLRKGFNGLQGVVVQNLDEDPLSGDVFVFVNRRGRLLKCFLWDRTGFVIVSKRLEQGRVHLRGTAHKLELDERRLKLLFDGISVGGFST